MIPPIESAREPRIRRWQAPAFILSTISLSLAAACASSHPLPTVAHDDRWDAVQVSAIPGWSIKTSAVRDSVVLVDEAWNDPRLWNLVAARPWLQSPTSGVLSGPVVADKLRAVRPILSRYRIRPISFWSYFGFAGKTTAETTACSRIDISGPNVRNDLYLVNTVAHENTHWLGSKPVFCSAPNKESFFEDGDYSDMTKPWLVSYAFGDLVECFVAAQGDETATAACFEHTIDGSCESRRKGECCVRGQNGGVPQNIADVRRQSGRCGERDLCEGL